MVTDFNSHDIPNALNHSEKTSIERNYSSAAVKNYVEQRKEKAAQQAQDEKDGVSKAKISERQWDEMKSYKYAII
jgi:hypothetical protein